MTVIIIRLQVNIGTGPIWDYIHKIDWYLCSCFNKIKAAGGAQVFHGKSVYTHSLYARFTTSACGSR